jgi:Zn-finger protein
LRVHLEGTRKLKRLWAQMKRQRMYQFRDRMKLQNWFFGCHKTSNTQIWILCPLWLCLDTANL